MKKIQVSLLIVFLFALEERIVVGAQQPRKFSDIFLPGVKSDTGRKHYGELGRVIKMKTILNPMDAREIKTKFQFYKLGQQVTFESDNFRLNGQSYPLNLDYMSKGFNPNFDTVIIIPGYFSSTTENWIGKMAQTLDKSKDINVITVSWVTSNRYIYDRVVANIPFVARQISIFLYYLAEIYGNSLDDLEFTKRIHMIGHSLGAHIAGFVGQDLDGRIGRITGLDPAGPSFDKLSTSQRLDPSDAIVVECFHTNSGKIHYMNAAGGAMMRFTDIIVKKIPLMNRVPESLAKDYSGEGDTAWFGIEAQVGHVDYYVNNGKKQPGCYGLMHLCDHQRSHDVVRDILDFELALGSEMTEVDRLLAFKSNGAVEFSVGTNLGTSCPSLLNGAGLSAKNDSSKKSSIKACVVPIDLTSHPDERKRELEREFGISFSNPSSNPKLFFKTRSDWPFVGDHYLLKLYLNQRPTWNDDCALDATIMMTDGTNTSVKLNKDFPIIDSSDAFRGIAIPFVLPNGANTHRGLRKVFSIAEDTSLNDIARVAQIKHIAATILPAYVKLEVKKSQATGIREVIRDRASSFFGRKKGQECAIGSIDSVGLQPIVTDQHGLIAMYDPNKSDLSQQITLIEPVYLIRAADFKANINGMRQTWLNQGSTLILRNPDLIIG